MIVQRTYNLPNCTLLIEGIGSGGEGVVSMMTNFEFRFPHCQERIVGGRDLMNALMISVNLYTQALQSGDLVSLSNDKIKIAPEGKFLHKLQLPASEATALNAQPFQIQLNTVQLFDLVEGIDQLCFDKQVVPDLTLSLDTEAYRAKPQPAAKLFPAFAGVASLAIAATVLYFVPVPTPAPKPERVVPAQTTPLSTPLPPKPF
ncbi:DUF4335 domain-containing protein [Tumidithrix elongata RA019]|uniref:DUF4335 domain-containing protein n=1 Tax=Tumidithrix elongata BACA0141 TaxID=2716417 RepID=A0AAW9Q2D4_9CYAN|nr:DUF4335 domain-containing protein [Tumidithrix elongata RA019]